MKNKIKTERETRIKDLNIENKQRVAGGVLDGEMG